MKKGMLVFPPQWLPINPYASVPMLAGQLHKAGYWIECKDSNLDFYDYLLSENNLRRTLEILLKDSDFTDAEAKYYHELILKVPNALRTIKYGDGFFELDNYKSSMKIIEEALLFASFIYENQKIGIYNLYDGRFEWEYRNLKDICSGTKNSMFYDFFLQQVAAIKKKGIDYLCISIPCYTQIVPAFTLAYILKNNTDITVCMGGNFLSRLEAGIRSNRDIFELYCDYILLGDGENSIVKFVDFLHGECKEEDVPGMIWKEDNHIYFNSLDREAVLDRIAPPYFKGFRMEEYYCPELCYAIEFARGCYWGKCSFCAVDISAKKYCMKPMENLVDEVEFLMMNYGIKNFVFVDEAIPVKKYVEFADEVLRRNLKIHFYSFARLEKGYTSEVFQRLKKAGLSILWWGYEAKSKRIMELMNKGIDVDERIPVLQRSFAAGIWNHCLCMAGFPNETYEEIQSTIEEIRNNRELFNSCALHVFFLSDNSEIHKNPEKYGITSIAVPRDMENHCAYKMKNYTEEEYQRIVGKFRKEYAEENKGRLWPQIYNNFDHLLVYLNHYGIDKVRSYDEKNNRTF